MAEPELFQTCRDAVADVLRLSEQLVNMDSGTDDLPGLERKAALLVRLFEGIGAESALLPAAAPSEGRWNIRHTFRGTGKARILVLTHYDTVFPAGEAARRPFRNDGENAWGPGVADMQTSIAMLLVGIPLLHDVLACRNYDTLTVFCNADEEKGSQGSRAQIAELAAQHDIALNTELSGEKGDLITVSARGMANGHLRVRGVTAHSAAEPPAGVNAGLELAHQLLQLSHLSRPDVRTAVNATLGGFGSKANVIPGEASALLNIRVADEAEFARVEADIRRIIQNRLFEQSKVEFDMEVLVRPYGNNATTLELAEKVRTIAREELGIELGYRHACGSNDTSFSAPVCPSLDGFGPGCVNMHNEAEHLPVASVAPRLYILLRGLEEICKGTMVPLARHQAGTTERRP